MPLIWDFHVLLNLFSLHCASQPLKAEGCVSGSDLHLRLFSLSHAPLLPASNVVSGFPDHSICRRAAPPPQSICSTYIHTIALHRTWQLVCALQIMQHISCHHRSLHSSPHPSGSHMQVLRLTELQVFLGWQTSVDATSGNSWPHAARSVELFDSHFQRYWPACCHCHYCWPLLDKVTDYGMHWPCYGSMITPQTPHTPHFSSTLPQGLLPFYFPPLHEELKSITSDI